MEKDSCTDANLITCVYAVKKFKIQSLVNYSLSTIQMSSPQVYIQGFEHAHVHVLFLEDHESSLQKQKQKGNWNFKN